jgi:thiol-disulfide isomerase/thioredoxin
MKKTLLIFLFFKIVVGYSAVMPLSINDSIINPLMFANNFSKKIYGKSALFTSGNRKFIIGVFDSNENDTLDARDVVSISELKTKKNSLYYCADKVNSIYAKKLKFILLEKRTYKILDLSLNKIALEFINATDEAKQYNFIDCLMTITQFDGLFRDSNNVELDSAKLNFSNNKPTIIYYTALYCQPCEKLKPLINQALNSKSVNMIIVSSDVDKYSNDKSGTYKNICYFSSQIDPSKVRSHGFPQILVFDKDGKFIESENNMPEEELIKKYAFPN